MIASLRNYFRLTEEHAGSNIQVNEALNRYLQSLPISVSEIDNVVDCLRLERYVGAATPNLDDSSLKRLIKKAYYMIRPLMPVSVRKHLQRHALRGWDQIPFPKWPVDCTVEIITEGLMKQVI